MPRSAGGCWPAAPPPRGPVGVTRGGPPPACRLGGCWNWNPLRHLLLRSAVHVGVVTGGPCPGSSSLGPLAATRAVHANSHAGRGRLPTVGRVSCVSAGQKKLNIHWYVVTFVYRCWYLVDPYLFICRAVCWYSFTFVDICFFICSIFNYMWYYLCIFIDICSYSYICGDIYWYWLIFVDGRDFCLVSPIGVWRSSICHVFSLTNVGLHTLLLQNSL